MVSNSKSAIMSLRPQFANALLAGLKCVELRRRKPALSPGTRIWFYSKIPVGQIVGMGILKDVMYGSPEAIWDRFSHCAGLEQRIFDAYFDQSSTGVALMFSEVAALEENISLQSVRALKSNFHPPQFYQWVSDSALQAELDGARLKPAFVSCDH